MCVYVIRCGLPSTDTEVKVSPERRGGAAVRRRGGASCPGRGAQRRAGELLITRALRCAVCRAQRVPGRQLGFRGIKYGLKVKQGRRGLVAHRPTGREGGWRRPGRGTDRQTAP